jgi:hypothetical protein
MKTQNPYSDCFFVLQMSTNSFAKRYSIYQQK